MAITRFNSQYLEEGVENICKKKKMFLWILFIMSILIRFQASNFYSISFLMAQPNIVCDNPDDGSEKSKVTCSTAEVCKWNNNNPTNTITYAYSIDTNGSYSLISQFHLECVPSKASLLTTFGGLGNGVFSFSYGFLQRGIGDAWTVKIACVVAFISLLVSVLVPYFWCQVITGFFIYGLSPFFVNNFQMYFNDFCPKEHRGLYSMALNSFFPISGIIYTIIFYSMSTWYSLRYSNIIVLIPAIILTFIFMVDSPFYHFNKGNEEDAIESLKKLSYFNRSYPQFVKWHSRLEKQIDESGNKIYYVVQEIATLDLSQSASLNDSEIELAALKQDENKLKDMMADLKTKSVNRGFIDTFKAVFAIPEERTIFLIMCALFIFIGYSRCYVSLQLASVSHISLISFIFFIIEAIIFVVQGIYSDNKSVGRVKSLKFLFAIGAVFVTITLIYTFVENNAAYRGPVILLIVRLSQETSARMLMTIGSEIYSRDTTSYTHGMNIFLSRIISVFASYLILSFVRIGIFILIITNIISFILMFFVKETNQQKIFNTLEEKYGYNGSQPSLNKDQKDTKLEENEEIPKKVK